MLPASPILSTPRLSPVTALPATPAALAGRRALSAVAVHARRNTEFANIRSQYKHVPESQLRHACEGYWVGGGAAVYGSFAEYQRVYRPLNLGPRAASTSPWQRHRRAASLARSAVR